QALQVVLVEERLEVSAMLAHIDASRNAMITDFRESSAAKATKAIARQDAARGGLPGGSAVELANGISPALAIELLAPQFIVSGVCCAVLASGCRAAWSQRRGRHVRTAPLVASKLLASR